jgi:hypothetical protein
MPRWAKWGAGTVLVLAAVLSAPILWNECVCTASRSARAERHAPLVDDRGYARRESDSYLSFPEWHIVYAYEDLAGVLGAGDASEFAYGRQIARFWSSLCTLTRLVTSRERPGVDTKVMLYTIGWSFTAEIAIKGAYERTLGRVFEWLRGAGQTEEDVFAARDMRGYAQFLRQTPWYEYPFGSRLAAFWRDTPLRGAHLPRKLERRAVFTLEYGAKAIYGALIRYASATALGASDLQIGTVVVGLDPADAVADPRITIVRDLGGGRTLVRTPRYQAYSDLLVALARRGRDIAEIAGNRRILVTVLAPRGSLPTVSGVTELFETPIQSRPGRRRIGLDVAVEQLAAAIRTLERAGASIEHVYDY